jgi:hypothetical protein
LKLLQLSLFLAFFRLFFQNVLYFIVWYRLTFSIWLAFSWRAYGKNKTKWSFKAYALCYRNVDFYTCNFTTLIIMFYFHRSLLCCFQNTWAQILQGWHYGWAPFLVIVHWGDFTECILCVGQMVTPSH